MVHDEELGAPDRAGRRLKRVVLVLLAVVAITLVALYAHAARRINRVSLAKTPKAVTTATAQAGRYQAVRDYVGTVEAWNEAAVGPQFVAAYVDTVLFRPGATVRRGEVLATLDCRNPSAASREVAARARGLQRNQAALADETARLKQMLDGGFASRNEVELRAARAAAEQGEVDSLRAGLRMKNLEVGDCVLRAPFNGDLVARFVDPGAYVRPGNPVVTIADRSTLRIVADAPEADFTVVAVDTPVHVEIEAAQKKLQGRIARRTPATDRKTRTVHFELDVDDRELPIGATARLAVPAGRAQPASLIPLRAATVTGDEAALFVVEAGHAKQLVVRVLGQSQGTLYVDPKLGSGAKVVVEGRASLADGEPVQAKEQPSEP